MLRVAGAVQPANPAPVSVGSGKKRARIEEGGLFLQRVPLQQPLETPAVQLVVPLQQPLEGLAIPPKGPELGGARVNGASPEEAGLFLQRRVPVQKPLETPVIQPVLPLQQPLEVPAVLPMRPKLGQQDSTARGGLFLQRQVPLQQQPETTVIRPAILPLQSQPTEAPAVLPKRPKLRQPEATAPVKGVGLFLQRRVPLQQPLDMPAVFPRQQPLEVPAVLPKEPQLGLKLQQEQISELQAEERNACDRQEGAAHDHQSYGDDAELQQVEGHDAPSRQEGAAHHQSHGDDAELQVDQRYSPERQEGAAHHQQNQVSGAELQVPATELRGKANCQELQFQQLSEHAAPQYHEAAAVLQEGPYEQDASPPSPSGLQREDTHEGEVAPTSAQEALTVMGGQDAAMRRLVEELQLQLDSTATERDAAVMRLLELRRQIALLIQPEVPGGPRSDEGHAVPQTMRSEVRRLCFGNRDCYGRVYCISAYYIQYEICISKHLYCTS